jgi:NAD-dependent dihydropyrimidine dehydrogenase PreA subunit
MKFVTFCFSGTGNTAWAVRKFHGILEEMGHEARTVSIESADAADSALLEAVRQADYVGFANPIYGANIPGIMRLFIKNLAGNIKAAGSVHKRIYYINTFGYVNAFGPICAAKLFKDTGFELACHVNIRLFSNVSTPKAKTGPIAPEALEKAKRKALLNLRKAAAQLAGGKRHIQGYGPYLLPGIAIRKISGRLMADNYKSMSVVMERCSRCMVCEKNCPTKSIEYRDGVFRFLPSCTSCSRCYNFCPTAALIFNGEYADPEIYKRYRGPGE